MRRFKCWMMSKGHQNSVWVWLHVIYLLYTKFDYYSHCTKKSSSSSLIIALTVMMRNTPGPLMLYHLYFLVYQNPVYMAMLKVEFCLSSRIFIWFGWGKFWCIGYLSGIQNDFSVAQIPKESKPFYGIIERWEIKCWY